MKDTRNFPAYIYSLPYEIWNINHFVVYVNIHVNGISSMASLISLLFYYTYIHFFVWSCSFSSASIFHPHKHTQYYGERKSKNREKNCVSILSKRRPNMYNCHSERDITIIPMPYKVAQVFLKCVYKKCDCSSSS